MTEVRAGAGRPPPGDPRGYGLVEALTGLFLGVLLLQVGWVVLRVHMRAVSAVVRQAEAADAGAMVHGLLRRDLRAGVRGRDWAPVAGDSIPLRGFRGEGVPCGPISGRRDTLTLLYRGTRAPDPGKDSVLILGRDGWWRQGRLRARRPASRVCAAGVHGDVERWSLIGPTGEAVLLRLFERGSYHLAEGALRYRRGRGGRQPLTGEVLDDRASTLVEDAGDRVRVRLGFRFGTGADPGPRWLGAVWARSPR